MTTQKPHKSSDFGTIIGVSTNSFVDQRFWIPSLLGQGCFIPVSQIVPQFTFDAEAKIVEFPRPLFFFFLRTIDLDWR